ncbi:hypothetical protein GCM10028832_23210 [Streptomyces sparsus]
MGYAVGDFDVIFVGHPRIVSRQRLRRYRYPRTTKAVGRALRGRKNTADGPQTAQENGKPL